VARTTAQAGEPPSLAQLERDALAASKDPAAWLRWAWALYGAGQPAQAAARARKAGELDADDPEPTYLLGMALKAAGDRPGAVAAFREAAAGLSQLQDSGRATMLRRLAVGQANWLERGMWDLEPETWVRT
jgi:Flp pilus assembly protein TadD